MDFLFHSLANTRETLVLVEPTVMADIDDAVVRDRVPSQLNRTFLKKKGGSIVLVEVLLEGTVHSVIEWRE